MAQTAENVFRDFTTDGVPSSGKHNVKKAEARELFGGYEAIINAFVTGGTGVLFQSKALLDANLNYPALTMVWVMNDATAANNGIYQKQGASGSGSWTRVADLPYSFIKASNAGAGTANAIAATTSIPIPAGDGVALITVNVIAENTGPATVSFNGGPTLNIVTSSGNAMLAGYLKPGMMLAGFKVGTSFRLLSEAATSAMVAAAEAAAAAAQAARDAAQAAAAGVNLPAISPGDIGKQLYVKADETGYELLPPAGGGVPAIFDGDAYGLLTVKGDETGFQILKRTALSPADFGWKHSDSLAARHAALVAWAADPRPGVLEANTEYEIDLSTGSLLVAAGKIIEGNGAWIYDETTHGKLLTLVPGALNTDSGMLAGGWKINGLRLRGALAGVYSNLAYGIFVEGTDNFSTASAPTFVEPHVLDDVEIHNIAGFGIWERFTYGGKRNNVLMRDIGYTGFMALSVKGLRVTDCTVENLGPGTSDNAYGFAFTRNPAYNLTAGPRSSDCVLDRWRVTNNPIYTGADTHAGDGIKILNGRAEGCKRGINIGYDADGEFAKGSLNCVARGNTLIGISTGATQGHIGILHTGYATATEGYSKNCVIDGNYIESFGDETQATYGGTFLQGTQGARVLNNHAVKCRTVGYSYVGNNYDCIASGNHATDAHGNSVASGVGVFNGNNKITFGAHTFNKTGAVLGSSNMPYGYNADASAGDVFRFQGGDTYQGLGSLYNGMTGKGTTATWTSL